ncbi:DEAD-domain-containing protein, partial [Fragilariopsis cylindrus CCMP1102]
QGFTSMTDIQARTWDAVLEGKDVVGRSRTGSGKAAFLLPTLERIIQQGHMREDGEDGVRILVISPTRELATQIHNTAEGLVRVHKGVGASCQVMFGGTARGVDLQMLDRRLPTILTATPGRLIDHLESSKLKDRGIHFADTVKNVDVLILDEMDRLLDMGFRDEIHKIVSYLPSKNRRQTLLFSATVPPTVQTQIQRFLNPSYESIDCIQEDDPNSHVANTVEQSYVVLPPTKLITGVVQLIDKLMKQQQSDGTTTKLMVFFNTTAQVEFFVNLFKKNGGTHRVMEIHSKLSQNERSKTSQRFRKVTTGILFTSDVSARGVDYPNVTHVLQVGSATDRETYIHRLGRTGRAGKSGTGILVFSDKKEVKPVLRNELTGIDIPANQELQEFIEEATSPEWMTRALNDDIMKDRASYCYKSLIGFYFLHFKNLGIQQHLDTVVDMINAFANQAGLEEPPALRVKVAQQYGLMKHKKINV